jgi:hypothetical protein
MARSGIGMGNVIGYAEILQSPYHRQRHASWKCLTPSDRKRGVGLPGEAPSACQPRRDPRRSQALVGRPGLLKPIGGKLAPLGSGGSLGRMRSEPAVIA